MVCTHKLYYAAITHSHSVLILIQSHPSFVNSIKQFSCMCHRGKKEIKWWLEVVSTMEYTASNRYSTVSNSN